MALWTHGGSEVKDSRSRDDHGQTVRLGTDGQIRGRGEAPSELLHLTGGQQNCCGSPPTHHQGVLHAVTLGHVGLHVASDGIGHSVTRRRKVHTLVGALFLWNSSTTLLLPQVNSGVSEADAGKHASQVHAGPRLQVLGVAHGSGTRP